jgi:hypothetical protein
MSKKLQRPGRTEADISEVRQLNGRDLPAVETVF